MLNQALPLLEQHFDTALAAPDGIARLRELILTLAMRSKLVKQDQNERPTLFTHPLHPPPPHPQEAERLLLPRCRQARPDCCQAGG